MTAGLHPITAVDPDDLHHVGNLLADLAGMADEPAAGALRRVSIALLEEALRQKRDLAHLGEQIDGPATT